VRGMNGRAKRPNKNNRAPLDLMQEGKMDDDEWATEVAKMELCFKELEKRGLIVDCGEKRWAERSGCFQTVYKLAPGVTEKDCRTLCNVPMASV
jgi:hypothetical protein